MTSIRRAISGSIFRSSGAKDYDSRGRSGNRPKYTGRIRVTGPDRYDLDRNGDGVGCDGRVQDAHLLAVIRVDVQASVAPATMLKPWRVVAPATMLKPWRVVAPDSDR
jgi:hypothetical protein